MITRNHATAYADLFKKAEDVLTNYKTEFANQSIGNIDDYFACLRTLATLEIEHPDEIDPIFTILPATEQTFDIDANTRSIKIPDNFAKYGVGVQGDEIAEILYFSIDRFFDAVDLAEKEILIQWRHEKDANSNAQNLSATYKRSLTLQPGKIVFGWPISKDITERPGNILFSVRFYEREGEDDNAVLIYSFSTTTATIKIQSGLDFELNPTATEAAIKKNEQIYKNLRNSKQAGLDYVIAMPEFIGYYYYVISADGEKESEALVSTNKIHDLPVQLVAKAAIPADAAGEVSAKPVEYEWYYALDKSAAEQAITRTEGSKTIEYIPVDRDNDRYNKNEFYYQNLGTDEIPIWDVYHVTGDTNPFDDVDQDGNPIQLYVQRSVCTPAKAGYFIAKAVNNYGLGKFAEKESDYWLVPFAAEPTYTYLPENKDLILQDGKGTITITAAVTDNGEISYQWYYNIENKWDGAIIEEGKTSNTIEVDKEGFFFLKATNKKNNSESKNPSDAIITTYAPSKPTIDGYKVAGQLQNDVNPQTGIVVRGLLEMNIIVDEAKLTYKDNVTYQWYNVGMQEGKDILVEIPGANRASYTPTIGGSYKCIVTNTYKNHSESESSVIFGVVA